jgi:tetratricopeptide (TPR) repeat protein
MTNRKGTSGQTGRRGRGKSTDDTVPAELPDLLADRRLLEQELSAMSRLLSQHDFASIEEANTFLQQLVERGGGQLPRTAPSTALEEAQDVIYQALQAPAARRTALARQALTISAECADAYVLLAEAATDPQEARQLYEQGVAAGERALGRETLTQEAGHFWGLVETRPYMRAREGLAHVLWHLDERAAAIAQAQALLHLNPGDNQGIRYVLASWLLAVGDAAAEEALEQLLAQYPDEWSAQWGYTQALLAFRRHGASRRADAALKRALQINPYVPLYLLGITPFPKALPAAYGMGDEQEAVLYVAEAAQPWVETPDAAEWITKVMLRLAAPALAAESVARAPAHRSARTPTRTTPTPSESSASPAKRSPSSKRPRRLRDI